MRLTDFPVDKYPIAAEATVGLIVSALRILEQHPRMGRRTDGAFRELIIQRGRSGYLALYRVDANDQNAEVLAIRHQRESGYHKDDL